MIVIALIAFILSRCTNINKPESHDTDDENYPLRLKANPKDIGKWTVRPRTTSRTQENDINKPDLPVRM